MDEKTQSGERNDTLRELLRMAGPRPPVSQERLDRIRSAVHSHWKAETAAQFRKRRLLWTFAGATAAAIAIVVFLVWSGPSGRHDFPVVATIEILHGNVLGIDASTTVTLTEGDALRAGASLETGYESRALLRLTDGTCLRMDHESRIRFVSAGQFFLQKGAVYFDSVQKHPAVEVRLETPFGTVVPSGTQFEVRIFDESMRIRVREGAVIITGKTGMQHGEKGSQIQLDRAGRFFRSEIPVYGSEWLWVSVVAPAFQMEGHTLREYLQWVVRENGWELEYGEKEISDSADSIVLHGTLVGMLPVETLSAVLPVCGLAHRLDGGTLIITKPR